MRYDTQKRCLLAGALGLLLFSGLDLSAAAQVLNTGPIVDRVDRVTREADRAARDIRRRAEEAARESRDVVTAGVQTVESALDPLADLPARLPIVGAGGDTLFVEVEVEGGWRAVERQWLATLEPGELAMLRKLNIEILEQTNYHGLGLSLLRFRVPEALDSRDALRRVLPEALVERFDRNHIYSPQQDSPQRSSGDSASSHAAESAAICAQPLKIGMVDTAVQLDHPAFAHGRIREKRFLEGELEQPDAHGTAVAGLMVGDTGEIAPRLPGATLYNASVFYPRNQYAQGATMMHLVAGLNWLVGEEVSVINMSLSGPDNRVLAAALARLIERGTLVVAAAGNAGPAAPPLYPAAYAGVIAATAVDSEGRIYRWANRGEQIDFAARGVSVLTARSGGGFGRESGTSMAAPVVSAFVACELADKAGGVNEVIERLASRALDLGEPGRDPVFGYGLLR